MAPAREKHIYCPSKIYRGTVDLDFILVNGTSPESATPPPRAGVDTGIRPGDGNYNLTCGERLNNCFLVIGYKSGTIQY